MQRALRLWAIAGLLALGLFGTGLFAPGGLLFGQPASAAGAGAADAVLPAEAYSDREVASYALGRNVVAAILEEGYEIDETMLARGIADALNGRESPFTVEELREALEALHAERNRRLWEEAAAWNLEYAAAFLEANGKRDGVHVTESGLQYEIIRPGSVKTPAASDFVKVHYRGVFADGLEFDSSYRRGVPSTFAVSDVIDGWSEALQLMAAGAVWRIFVPPHLAYGEAGAGPIGPNELLIFEIELLEIESPEVESGDR